MFSSCPQRHLFTHLILFRNEKFSFKLNYKRGKLTFCISQQQEKYVKLLVSFNKLICLSIQC